MRKRIKYTINEVVKRPVTKKEFFRRLKEDVDRELVSRAELLKNGTFTETEIKKLTNNNILCPRKFKNKIYFSRKAVSKGIKILSGPPMKGTPFTAHTLEIKSVNIKQYGKERISNFKRNQRSNTGTY